MKRFLSLAVLLLALAIPSVASAVSCVHHSSTPPYIFKGLTYCYTTCSVPIMDSTTIGYFRAANGQSWSTYSTGADHADVWFEVVANYNPVGDWLQAGLYVGSVCGHVASDQPHLYIEWFVGTASPTCSDPNYGFIDLGAAGVGVNHTIRYDWEGGNTWQVAVDGIVRAIKTFQVGPANDVEEMTEDDDHDNICDSIDGTLGPFVTNNGTQGWPWVYEDPYPTTLIVGPGQFAPDSMNPFEIDWNDRGAVQATNTQHWLPGFGMSPPKVGGYIARTPGMPAIPGKPNGFVVRNSDGSLGVSPFALVTNYGPNF